MALLEEPLKAPARTQANAAAPTATPPAKWDPAARRQPTAASATSATTTPQPPPPETAESRIGGLLENPVVVQMGERAKQQFHSRGLLNTSLAVQGANEAMLSKAFDIASSDANQINTYRTSNLDRSSREKISAADNATSIQTAGINAGAQIQSTNLRGEWDMKSAAQQQEFTRENTKQEQDFTRETNAQKYAAGSSEIYSTGINNIEGDYITQAGQIDNNKDMSPEQKTAAKASLRTATDQRIMAWNAAASNLPGWTSEWAVIPVAPATSDTAAATEPAAEYSGPVWDDNTGMYKIWNPTEKRWELK